MSAFMDAGYRVYRGQEPYIDFYYIAGPVHLYMHAFFYFLFGFNKTAILAHLLSVSALMTVTTFFIARKHLDGPKVLLVTALTSVAFYGPIAHPWYDQNAAVWIAIALLMWETRRAAFACGVLISISFMTKANFGVAAGALFLVLTALERMSLRYLLGVGVGMGAILATLRAPIEFFDQTLFAYNPTALIKWDYLARVIFQSVYFYLFLIAVFFFMAGARDFKKGFLLTGLLAISIFTTFTGSMTPEANLVFLGLDCLYLLSLAGELRRKAFLAAAFAITFASFFHAMRASVFPAVWYWNSSNEPNYSMTSKPLRGWRANRTAGEGVDQAVFAIKANVPPEESLFILPDATVIYGLTDREPYAPAPFIFHLKRMPPEGRLLDSFREHFLSHPPDWILLRDQHHLVFNDTDLLLEWLGIKERIAQKYEERWRSGTFRLLRRKD